jgi:hypothetical protein
MNDKTNNTIFYKVFNEDVRADGIINRLKPSAFKVLFILMGYCDCSGVISGINGKPISKTALADICGLDKRTFTQCLSELIDDRLLLFNEDDNIQINNWVAEQNYRGKANKKSAIGLKHLADGINKLNNTLGSDEQNYPPTNAKCITKRK